jgi:cytochrome c biogenesis protein CcmG/thiol:disulfide interchange protein DsbE
MVGRTAAAFGLRTLDGARVSLADLRGSPVVVNFWASWCVPCREEASLLEALAAQGPGGLRVVGVLYEDSPENARAFAEQYGVSYPTLLDPDGRAAIDYGVLGIPETFFVDRSGIIRAHQVGALAAGDLPRQVSAIVGP